MFNKYFHVTPRGFLKIIDSTYQGNIFMCMCGSLKENGLPKGVVLLGDVALLEYV